ncbi:thioredoxin 1 [Variovorax sp. GrIS 2.14]
MTASPDALHAPAVLAMPGAPAQAPAIASVPWVVCLCAEWCGACREYRPLFEQVARAHPGLRFAWVDIEDHADIADDFDVETFPTLLVAGADGTRFAGPLLPHAETLSRLLSALQSPQPAAPEVTALLKALEASPAIFSVGTP